MKIRRANQLVRVFGKYTALLLRKRIKNSKRVVSQNLLVFLFIPVMFTLLLITTIPLLSIFPYFLAISLFVVFLIPKVRTYLFEAIQNYLILLLTIFSVSFGKKIIVWKKPEDRSLLTEDMLRRHSLI